MKYLIKKIKTYKELKGDIKLFVLYVKILIEVIYLINKKMTFEVLYKYNSIDEAIKFIIPKYFIKL